MKRRRLLFVASIFLVAALLAPIRNPSRGDDPSLKLVDTQPSVPPKVAAKIIETESKEIQDILSVAKVNNKDRKRAFTTTAVIAGMADANSKDPKFAAIRDQAIKMLDALVKEDLAMAKEHATGLLDGKATGSAKKTDLHMYFWDAANANFDRDLVMQLFKSQRAGGKGFESTIKNWIAAPPNESDLEKARITAYEIATLADIIEKVAPGPGPGVFPAKWIQFSKELKEAAKEAAKKNSRDDMRKAMNKLDTACVNCHNLFKKNLPLPPPPKP